MRAPQMRHFAQNYDKYPPPLAKIALRPGFQPFFDARAEEIVMIFAGM